MSKFIARFGNTKNRQSQALNGYCWKMLTKDTDTLPGILIRRCFCLEESRQKKSWSGTQKKDSHFADFSIYSHLFSMVKWEDEDPWIIKDLLKLPEKENENEN